MRDLRVLIVEDDPMVIEINRKVIQDCPGFTVAGTARNGTDGLKAISKYKPDLVILDIFMPHLNGLEFLKEMRQGGFDMDVIMITASQDAQDLKEGLRYGVVDYIIKPFRLERFKASLENYLQMVRKLERQKSISQHDVDFLVSGYKTGEELPKGLSLYTLERIRQYIAGRPLPATADEIADSAGVARVTARRYLEYLVSTGEADTALEYGSVGRPIKKYTVRICTLTLNDRNEQKDQ